MERKEVVGSLKKMNGGKRSGLYITAVELLKYGCESIIKGLL